MKSLNAKKIAAAAAGGALVAAAFAGAVTVDSAVGNYQFFTNGEPNVKIVVGSRAQIWDGVAAGNIAAMIGNLAYSDQDVVAGGAAPAVGGAAAGAAGTVSGKSVSLEITTPSGTTGQTGTAVVSTQLYDFLDNDLKTAGTARDNDASSASTLIGDGITSGGYYVSNTLYPDVAYRGAVANLGSYNVIQEDGYYITAQSYYDFTDDVYEADRIMIAYTSNFTDPIPFHVDIVNGSTAGRSSNDDKLTENRNVKIKFLGKDFVITDFENGTATTNPSISLGEAAVFKQMKPGESITLGDRTLKLVSISPIAIGSSTLPFAYFEVSDKTGARIDYFSMSKDTSNYNKNGIILDVRDVFVGGGDSSYGEIAAYASSITVQDGQKLTFEGDDASTKLNQDAGWSANIGFSSTSVGTDNQRTLKQIRLTGPTSTRVKAGKSFNLIERPISKVLTFLGLESIDRDTLTIQATGRQTMLRMSNAAGDPNPVGSNVDVNVTQLKSGYASAFNVGGKNYDTVWMDEYNGRIIVYDSTASQANYTTPSDAADNSIDYYYPATTASNAIQLYTNYTRPGPLSLANSTLCEAGCVGPNFYNGTTAFIVAYNDTTGGLARGSTLTIVFSSSGNIGGSAALTWTAVPGASAYAVYAQNATGTALLGWTGGTTFNTNATSFVSGATAPNSSARSVKIRIWEPVIDNTATLNGYWNVESYAADGNYLYNSSQTVSTLTTQYVFTGTAPTNLATNWPGAGLSVEQGYVSPGGGIIKTLSLDKAVVEYPKKLVHARYQFGAPVGVQNVTSTGNVISTKTLAEAEEYKLGGGYSVKVSAIAGTAQCTGGGAGGAAACTPSKAAVVTPLDTSADALVVLDSQASSTGQLIVVGGPMVNTVAAGTPGVAEVTSKPGDSVVRIIGGRVIVAGYTAQDTQDAANELVKWLAQNRDTVRGV